MKSDINTSELKCNLEKWYEEVVGFSNPSITSISSPVNGMVNETHFHTVEHSDQSVHRQLSAVLRVQPGTRDTPIPNVDVLAQAKVLQSLSMHPDLLTPKVFWIESDRKWLGREFYVMEKLSGEPVFDAGTYPKEPDVLREMYRQSIEKIVDIHSIDWKLLKLGNAIDRLEGDSPLKSQLDEYWRVFKESAQGDSYPLLNEAFDWLYETVPAESTPVLNWGDARIGNLLFDGPNLTAVLDWEIFDITSREVDLGWFTYFERFFMKDGVDLRPGAFTKSEIISIYEDKSGHLLGDLEWFEKWAALRLSIMRMRAGRRAIAVGEESHESRVDYINFATIEMAKLFGYPEPQ